MLGDLLLLPTFVLRVREMREGVIQTKNLRPIEYKMDMRCSLNRETQNSPYQKGRETVFFWEGRFVSK